MNFWLRFGLANIINDSSMLKICFVYRYFLTLNVYYLNLSYKIWFILEIFKPIFVKKLVWNVCIKALWCTKILFTKRSLFLIEWRNNNRLIVQKLPKNDFRNHNFFTISTSNLYVYFQESIAKTGFDDTFFPNGSIFHLEMDKALVLSLL